MDLWAKVEAFLETDPIGIGCEENLALVHAYVQMMAEGDDADEAFSAVTQHLRQCPPCAEDLRGLLEAVRGQFDEPASF